MLRETGEFCGSMSHFIFTPSNESMNTETANIAIEIYNSHSVVLSL